MMPLLSTPTPHLTSKIIGTNLSRAPLYVCLLTHTHLERAVEIKYYFILYFIVFSFIFLSSQSPSYQTEQIGSIYLEAISLLIARA